MGLTQKQAVLLMYAITALLGCVSIVAAKANFVIGVLLVLVILCACVWTATKIGIISKDNDVRK